MKIFRRLGTKEKICKHCEQQTVYHQLLQRVESAKDYVECNPNQGKPACPVTAAEHEHSANNRRETDEANPYDVIMKRMLCLKLDEVVRKSDRARCCEYATEDSDGEWTRVHRVSLCANSCSALLMMFGQRLSDFPMVSEGINDPPHAPTIRLINHRHDDRRSG
jgi:hypothetical protein